MTEHTQQHLYLGTMMGGDINQQLNTLHEDIKRFFLPLGTVQNSYSISYRRGRYKQATQLKSGGSNLLVKILYSVLFLEFIPFIRGKMTVPHLIFKGSDLLHETPSSTILSNIQSLYTLIWDISVNLNLQNWTTNWGKAKQVLTLLGGGKYVIIVASNLLSRFLDYYENLTPDEVSKVKAFLERNYSEEYKDYRPLGLQWLEKIKSFIDMHQPVIQKHMSVLMV